MNEQREVIRAQLSCGVDYYKGEKGDKPVKGVDYFTQEDIDSIIEQIEAGDIDLTSYATKEYVNDKIDDIVETDPTVPEWAKQANKPTYTAAEVGALPANTVIPTVPTNVSAFTNDAGYLTSHQSLDNYATKSYVEQVVAGIETGALKRRVVSVLPSPASGIDENTIYMVANSGSGDDVYDEYLYVNNKWERIGSSAVDLVDYATKNYVDTAVSSIEISDVIAGYASTSPTSDPEPYYLDFVLDDMDMTIRGKQDRLVFNTAYNENTNKVATMADIPSGSGSSYTAGSGISIDSNNVISTIDKPVRVITVSSVSSSSSYSAEDSSYIINAIDNGLENYPFVVDVSNYGNVERFIPVGRNNTQIKMFSITSKHICNIGHVGSALAFSNSYLNSTFFSTGLTAANAPSGNASSNIGQELTYIKNNYATKAELPDGLPTAPSTDGTYFLTTTITSGTPTYSWENVVIGGSY